MDLTAAQLARQAGLTAIIEMFAKYEKKDKQQYERDEFGAFGDLVAKLVNAPIDPDIKVPGMRPEKVQIFSLQKWSRKDILEEQQKRKDWHKRLMLKREKAALAQARNDQFEKPDL